jgi:hypothetical protein
VNTNTRTARVTVSVVVKYKTLKGRSDWKYAGDICDPKCPHAMSCDPMCDLFNVQRWSLAERNYCDADEDKWIRPAICKKAESEPVERFTVTPYVCPHMDEDGKMDFLS